MPTHVIQLDRYCAQAEGVRGRLVLGTWASYGLEQLQLVLGDGWDGRTVTAVFHGPKTSAGTTVLAGSDGLVPVPQEATAAAGYGTITIVGVDADSQRISVDVPYMVMSHAPVDGNESAPTPDIWQQFVAAVKADADRAEQAAGDAADSAAAAAKSAEAAAESAQKAEQAGADIGAAKDDALQAIQQAQATGVQAVEGATTTGVQAVQQAHQAALDDIATDRQQALTDIEAAGDKQTAAITSGGAAALEAIGRTEQAAIGQVQQAGTAQVTAVESAGQSQQTAIEQAGTSWQQQIEAAGTAEMGRWAPAIWDVDPLAAEHDIYAAKGAPLRVMQQGATTQGADPAPDNPQEIKGTGLNGKVSFDGTEQWTVVSDTYLALSDAVPADRAAIDSLGFCNRFPYKYAFQGRNVFIVGKNIDGIGTMLYIGKALSDEYGVDPDRWKEALTQWASEGKPLAMCYNAVSGTDYTLGISTESTAGDYRGQALAIGSPLYGDGSASDEVANDVPSGCDKCIIVDETMTFTEAGSGDTVCWNLPNGSTPGGVPKSWCISTLGDKVFYTSNVGTRAFTMPQWAPQFGSVDELNEYCQEMAAKGTPLKIWYKSTAYTEAADLHIDKITRRWKMLELDGSEVWYKLSSVDNGYQIPLTGGVDNLRCTHLIHNTTTSDGTIYLNSSGWLRVYGPWDTVPELTAWLSAQKAAGTPVKVLYQLAVPETYAADPHTLPALGALPETVKATGQSTVSYSADTKHYIDSKITQAVAAAVSLTGGTT